MSGIEALGVGASVVAIIQITDRIVGFCKFFLESLQDAPSDLRVLLIEISTLRTILENLRFLNGSGHNRAAIENSLSGKDGPLDGCQRAVSELEKLLPLELMKRKAKGKKKMGTLTLAALAWPMREKQAKKLIDEILNYKVTIALALTTSSLYITNTTPLACSMF
jgi:hypothetical protein